MVLSTLHLAFRKAKQFPGHKEALGQKARGKGQGPEGKVLSGYTHELVEARVKLFVTAMAGIKGEAERI